MWLQVKPKNLLLVFGCVGVIGLVTFCLHSDEKIALFELTPTNDKAVSGLLALSKVA